MKILIFGGKGFLGLELAKELANIGHVVTIFDKNIKGKNGSFQNSFKVYNRENENCLSPGCKGMIRKKFITNRSTFFCNICQK